MKKLKKYLQQLGFSKDEILNFLKEVEGLVSESKNCLFDGCLSFLNNIKENNLEKSKYVEDMVKQVPRVLCVERNKEVLAVVDSVLKTRVNLASEDLFDD